MKSSGIDLSKWIQPPVQLTPDLVHLLRQDAVKIPFAQLPADVQGNYGVPDTDPEAETIYGYFYLADEGKPEGLNDIQLPGLFVELSECSYFYPIGGHGQGNYDDQSLGSVAAEDCLYLISYQDFERLAGGMTPVQYRLKCLGHDRSHEDPYLRLQERLNRREADQQAGVALMRAGRAGAGA